MPKIDSNLIKFSDLLSKEENVSYKYKFHYSKDFERKIRGVANSKGIDDFDKKSNNEDIKSQYHQFLDNIYGDSDKFKIKNIQTLFTGLSDLFNFRKNEVITYNSNHDDKKLFKLISSRLSQLSNLKEVYPEIYKLLQYLEPSHESAILTTKDLVGYMKNMYPRLALFTERKPEWFFLKNEHVFQEAKSMLFLVEHLKAAYTLYNYNQNDLHPKLSHALGFEDMGANNVPSESDELNEMKKKVTRKMNNSIDLFIEQFHELHGEFVEDPLKSEEIDLSFTKNEKKILDDFLTQQDINFLSYSLDGSFRFKDNSSILRKVTHKKVPLRSIFDLTGTKIEITFHLLQAAIEELEKDDNNKDLVILLRKLERIISVRIAYSIVGYLPGLVGTDTFMEDRVRNYYLKSGKYSTESYSGLHVGAGSFMLNGKTVELPHEVIIALKYVGHEGMREKQNNIMLDDYLTRMDVYEFYEYLLRYIMTVDPVTYLKISKNDDLTLLSSTKDEVRKKGIYQQKKNIEEFLIEELLSMDHRTFTQVINKDKGVLYTQSILGKRDFKRKNGNNDAFEKDLLEFASYLASKFNKELLSPLLQKTKALGDEDKYRSTKEMQEALISTLNNGQKTS